MIEKKRKEANKIPGATLENDRNIDNNFDNSFDNSFRDFPDNALET